MKLSANDAVEVFRLCSGVAADTTLHTERKGIKTGRRFI
jgi:hypothetical protein